MSKNMKDQINDNPTEGYGKVTLEDIKEAVDYVFNSPRNKAREERRMKLMRGCSTYGFYEFGQHCGNEKCEQCNNSIEEFSRMFKEEVEKGLCKINIDKK